MERFDCIAMLILLRISAIQRLYQENKIVSLASKASTKLELGENLPNFLSL